MKDTPKTMNRLFHSPLATPSHRTIKRSKLPPPLELEPFLTPPLTVKRVDDMIYNFSEQKNYNLDEVSPLYYKQKNIIKEVCSICEEPITLKLRNERTIELDCSHQCHYDCYLLTLNKADPNEFPSCSVCNSNNVKPKDEDILEEIYAKNLTTSTVSQDVLQSPIEFLPKPQMSGFHPFTPINQVIENHGSAGFQPSVKSAISSISMLSSPIPKWSSEDLKTPQVSVISEYSKYNLNGDQTVQSLLNIFTNELQTSKDDYGLNSNENSQLKKDIHEEIIKMLEVGIKSPSIDFGQLCNLRIFDFLNISVDGKNWEPCYSFIFDDLNLILVSKQVDSIIGSILLKDYSSCYKKEQDTLILTFKTQTLPELQIHSVNNVLISKYEDYFKNKLRASKDIPLIQMSTNSWDLLDNSEIKIPSEIKRFNDLTAKGLDLPFTLKKAILPAPRSLGKDVILVLQLFNATKIPDDGYLKHIQGIIKTALGRLKKKDKLGLVLLGRDGRRILGVEKATYLGMIDSEWDGWDELIEELEVFEKNSDISGVEYFDLTISTTMKLLSMIPSEEDRIKKIVMVNSVVFDDVFDNKKISELFGKGCSVEYVDVTSGFNIFNKSLVNKLLEFHEISQGSLKLFKQFEYKTFGEFGGVIQDLQSSLDRTYYIESLAVELSITETYRSCFTLKSLDTLKFQGVHMIEITLNSIDDGFYKNLKFDIDVDYKELYKKIQRGTYVEIPIINYKVKYLDKTISRNLLVKFNVNANVKAMSRISKAEDESQDEKSEFIDIPLLPPLSSLKDSLFVKREIELLVINHLYTGKDLNNLISLIFGMIRGCSTTHLDFYKLSKFKFQFKNFTNYIDELAKRLRTVNTLDEKYCLINELKSEKYDFTSVSLI